MKYSYPRKRGGHTHTHSKVGVLHVPITLPALMAPKYTLHPRSAHYLSTCSVLCTTCTPNKDVKQPAS